MNIIEKIQEQLSQFNISRTSLKTLQNITSFKKKILIAPVLACTLSSLFYISLSYSLDVGFFTFVLLWLVFGFSIFSVFSHFSINGKFFKTLSFFFKKSTTLQSFISYANYQDKIILDMFNNSSMALSILEFYNTMHKLNFSHSPFIDNMDLSNEEIAFNLKKINKIIDNDDEISFLNFFKEKFLPNFYYCSQNQTVTEFLGSNKEHFSQPPSIEKSFIPMQDMLDTIKEPLDLKQKFKAAL